LEWNGGKWKNGDLEEYGNLAFELQIGFLYERGSALQWLIDDWAIDETTQ
jgi:hypothetical protein